MAINAKRYFYLEEISFFSLKIESLKYFPPFYLCLYVFLHSQVKFNFSFIFLLKINSVDVLLKNNNSNNNKNNKSPQMTCLIYYKLQIAIALWSITLGILVFIIYSSKKRKRRKKAKMNKLVIFKAKEFCFLKNIFDYFLLRNK